MSPHWGVGWKTCIAMHCCSVYIYIYIYIYQYLLYIHLLECTQTILQTLLQKDMVVLEFFIKKTNLHTFGNGCQLTAQEMKLNAHATCLVNSLQCREKVAGVLF